MTRAFSRARERRRGETEEIYASDRSVVFRRRSRAMGDEDASVVTFWKVASSPSSSSSVRASHRLDATGFIVKETFDQELKKKSSEEEGARERTETDESIRCSCICFIFAQ